MAAENENAKSRWERIKKQMRHTYRLVVMNNETFEEVGSYRLTLLNVYIFISTVLVVVASKPCFTNSSKAALRMRSRLSSLFWARRLGEAFLTVLIYSEPLVFWNSASSLCCLAPCFRGGPT